MLLSIVIFFVVIIAVGTATALGLSFYLTRRAKSLAAAADDNQFQLNFAPPARRLFEPDADELRSIELEAEKLRRAKAAEQKRLLKIEKAEKVQKLIEQWQTAPNKKTTAELLNAAAAAESAEIFSDAAENIVRWWRARRIENLTAPDLADLLDSHFRTLPQQERTSGAIFWVKRQIENLRAQSEEIK